MSAPAEQQAQFEVEYVVGLLAAALERGLDFDTVNDAAQILARAAWRLEP